MTDHLVTLRIKLMALAALGLVLSLLGFPVQAYHFPWDQGHDTTDWNDPPPPGPCEGPKCDPCNSTGSPVYIPTGHFIWSDNDLVLPGRPGLGLTRTYNSNDPRNGLFGNGWSVGCDRAMYRTVENGAVIYWLRVANGKRYEYKQQADGRIVPPPGRFEQVAPQPDGSVQLIALDGSRQAFRTDGKLLADIDTNGNTLTYRYGSNGLLSGMDDGNGRSLSFTYNSGGRIALVADHAGRRWSYGYDAAGNLISVTDPLGGVQRYAYQSFTPPGDGYTYQQLTQVTDPSGVIVTSVTYGNERVTSYSAGENRYTYSYNLSTKTVTKTDRPGSRWTFVYNDDGLMTQETDPLGFRVSYTYDTNGRPLTRTDELGQVWRATYDSLGRVTSRTNPLGDALTLEYSGNSPRPVKITTPSGRVTQLAYDAKLNPVAITDAAGATSRMEWSAQGDIVAVIDALGNRTGFSYNAFGLPLAVTDPLGRVTYFDYDAVGNLTSLRDPAGATTRSSHDALGRVVQLLDALNRTTALDYDAAGRLTRLTDPAGATTAYSFDSFGRLATRTAPDGRQHRYQYRLDNLLSQVTLPDGRAIGYGYDTGKRLIQENAAGATTSFSYNARGELTGANGSGGTINRSYDTAGRLQQETNNGQTVSLTRNREGERTQMTALGLTTAYAQDARGLITQISSAAGAYAFNYDAAGRRTQLRLPNGATTTYAYDAASQLARLTHSGIFSATYDHQFDAAGRMVASSGDGAPWGYQYDALGQLTQATHGTEAFNYSYDTAGNILNNGRRYDRANRLVEDSERVYTYDQNGNLTSKQHKTSGSRTLYTWNAKNQLVSYARYPTASAPTPDLSLAFTYDPLGRRASKTENGITERYVYDGPDLIGVLDQGSAALRQFTFGPNIDEPLSISGVSSGYFHTDHLGSIKALSSNASVVSQYSYDPYGKTQVTGDATNRFRYTAREQDAEDLYYYRARYYDPTLQRFISEDPIEYSGGFNLYRYAHDNPINVVDPDGQFAWIIAGGVIGAVINTGVTYFATGGNASLQQLGAAAASGFIAGSLGAMAGPLGGTIAGALGATSNGLVASVAAGVLSAGASAAGQAVANQIDPCNATNPLNAALWGGIGGGAAKKFFPTKNLNTWLQSQYFGPKTFGGLFGSSNAWFNNGSFATASGVGAASNFSGLNPF